MLNQPGFLGRGYHRSMTPRSAISLATTFGFLALACGSEAAGAAVDGSGGRVAADAGAAGTAGAAVGGVSAAGASTSGVATGGTATAGSGGGGASAGAASGSGGAAAGAAAASGGGAGGAGGAASLAPFKGVANSECADLTRLKATWWYNWVLSPGGCKASEFVPMIAGKAEKQPAQVQSALSSLKAAGYRTVLGFNEPNKADQANLSVAQVLELWPSLTTDPDVRVGSPATSADAKAWFEEFMTEVEARDLRVDFVAIHWYGWNAGSCDDAKELESYITWAEKFGRPIWITEFGCLNASNPSAKVVEKFYASALEAIARHPQVERYAWYPWTTNNELVLSGDLTPLGSAFAAAPATR
jgi:hypothetical protein